MGGSWRTVAQGEAMSSRPAGMSRRDNGSRPTPAAPPSAIPLPGIRCMENEVGTERNRLTTHCQLLYALSVGPPTDAAFHVVLATGVQHRVAQSVR